MTSNELNEILNKTRRTKDISLSVEQIEELVKDLEELEELKVLMGTPIQDIMKRLKILEILKRTKLDLWDFKHDIENFKKCVSERTPYEWYSMHYMEFSREILSEKEFDLVWEWLEDGKNNL